MIVLERSYLNILISVSEPYDVIRVPGVHITKNPNFDTISTFYYFHYKKLGDPNFL